MTQTKRFILPVYKSDGTNRLIETGDTVKLRLKDGTYSDETVTAVADDGKSVSWDHTDNSTRQGDVAAVHYQHRKSCANYGGSVSPHASDPAAFS